MPDADPQPTGAPPRGTATIPRRLAVALLGLGVLFVILFGAFLTLWIGFNYKQEQCGGGWLVGWWTTFGVAAASLVVIVVKAAKHSAGKRWGPSAVLLVALTVALIGGWFALAYGQPELVGKDCFIVPS